GNVGVGAGITAPANKMDIAQTTRTGTHGSGLPLYVTGTISQLSNGIEFRHDNGTQGVGIGYGGIYATGSNANQDLAFASRGTGWLRYTTNGTERMHIRDNGFVGIGVATALAQLEVFGGVANLRFGPTNTWGG